MSHLQVSLMPLKVTQNLDQKVTSPASKTLILAPHVWNQQVHRDRK